MQVEIREEQGHQLVVTSMSVHEAQVLMALICQVADSNTLIGQWIEELHDAGIDLNPEIKVLSVSESPALIIST